MNMIIILPEGKVVTRYDHGLNKTIINEGRDLIFIPTNALRSYLQDREEIRPFDPVFCKDDGTRMTYETLRQLIRRRAEEAKLLGIPYPHDFRRAFAITLWRNGVDIVTISRLMGHSSLEVLKRYLA
jgi:site-specific recombinase XerD